MNSPNIPLAITMGDPAGIGPEIVVAAIAKNASSMRTVVIGSGDVMRAAVDVLNIDLQVHSVERLEDASFKAGYLDVLETANLPTLPPLGIVSKIAGQAAYDAIIAGIRLARSGHVSGLVTAPINKAALASAGINYPGHTEILADHGGVERVAMMLGNDDIRTVLVTIHCSLRDAIDRGDHDAQMSAIRLANEGARALGISQPRVAVAGLNPHAGEGGLFGREEIETITPAIQAARKEGINVSGPWPGDTVFMQARKGQFDIVVAQYHDQGLIPVKYMGLEKGVNITLGLPFIRTSPDHGTAFDIAGKGIADPSSLETAISYASRLISSKYKETA